MVMANILIKCGKYEEAIEKLDYVLSLNGWYTVNNLIMEKDYDPLRDMPEFQILLKKYSLKSTS